MKKILLLILLLNSVATFALEAYPVPNLINCSGVFDLTVQTPVTLGNQNPEEFGVLYFLTEADAHNNVNPIANPENYTALSTNQLIVIRVFNMFNGNYELTGFHLLSNVGEVPQLPDVTNCGPYALPPLESGHYYSQPNGQGDLFNAGFLITFTRTIYVFSGEGDCSSETSFHITIQPKPVIQTPISMYACAGTTFNLADLAEQIVAYNDTPVEVAFYHTMADASDNINAIPNLQYPGVNQEIVFVKVLNPETGCFRIEDFHLQVQNCSDAIISGVVRFDANGNGCNNEDPVLAGVTVVAIHNNDLYYAYTNENGEYHFTGLPVGEYHVHLVSEDQPFNVVMPEMYTFLVTGDSSDTANFCVTFEEYHDLGIQFYSSAAPVIGANRGYILKIHNYGSVTASGTVNVTFDSDVFTVVNSAGGIVNGNTIDFTVTNLAPGHTISLEIVLHVAEPPVAVAGNAVGFSAHLEYELDENDANDHVILNQTLVSSLDPNDITVNEGSLITFAQAQSYLHYMVRFQNTGTAEAMNIRIENELSDLLDWNTFRPVSASHDYFAERIGGNVTFRFNDVNLPAAQENEAASHGYIIYEIKPIATLGTGQLIENNANIYFDFNPPVLTNTVGTEIINLGVGELSRTNFILYPNPAKDQFFLSANITTADISIYDLSGKQLQTSKLNFSEGKASVDISQLANGIYMVKMVSDGKSVIKKLVVQ